MVVGMYKMRDAIQLDERCSVVVGMYKMRDAIQLDEGCSMVVGMKKMSMQCGGR